MQKKGSPKQLYHAGRLTPSIYLVAEFLGFARTRRSALHCSDIANHTKSQLSSPLSLYPHQPHLTSQHKALSIYY